MPTLDPSKFVVESKAHELWRKTKEKGKQALEYVEQHKETIAMVTPVVLGAFGIGKKILGGAVRQHNLREERELKDYRVYDRRLGAYLRLRRPLKNSDWKKIELRLERGERLVDVLRKLDMLK